ARVRHRRHQRGHHLLRDGAVRRREGVRSWPRRLASRSRGVPGGQVHAHGRRLMADALKLRAAERALAFVEPGMKLGLGTGSTAARFVDLLGAKVKEGLDVVGVPTSETTRVQAA